MRGLHQLQGFPSSNCTNSAQCPHAAPQAHTTHLKLPPAACCQPCRCSCSCCCWPPASLSCPPPTGPRGPTPTSARPLTTSSPSPRLCSSDRRSSAPLLPAAATCFGVAPPGVPAAAAAEPGVAAAAAARTLCSSWLSLPLSRSVFQEKFQGGSQESTHHVQLPHSDCLWSLSTQTFPRHMLCRCACMDALLCTDGNILHTEPCRVTILQPWQPQAPPVPMLIQHTDVLLAQRLRPPDNSTEFAAQACMRNPWAA
jgi:hypothetical protein